MECCNQNQMIHHSALSFRKLTSMKIVDRSSCYIVGISKDLADKAMLAKYELFGQFGDILSIRIIQDKDPCEVYIRFATQSSAVRAIDWCNGHGTMFTNAKHGYQKYCIKFINGQNCKRSHINCPNRHSWADTQDILTFKNSRLVPSAVVVPGANTKSEESAKLLPNRGAVVRAQTQSELDQRLKREHEEEMRMLQKQFVLLQAQYAKQGQFVGQLMTTMQKLQQENTVMAQQMSVPNMAMQQMQQVAMRNMQVQQGNMANMGNMNPLQWARHMQQQQSRGRLPQGNMTNMHNMMPQMGSQHGSQHGSHGSHSPMSSQAMKQQQMRNGVQAVQQRPFVVSSGLNSSPELDLMASCHPLPEATIPLPESVMNGTLDDIVDQVISDTSLSTFSQ